MFTQDKRLVRLEMTTRGHNKYYEVEIRETIGDTNSYQVWIHWGRIGNKGSWQQKDTFTAFVKAKNYAIIIVKSKIDKGYKIVSTEKETKTTPEEEKEPKVAKEYQRFIALLE